MDSRRSALILLVLALVSPAMGQQTYTLSESDEWEASGGFDPASAEGQLALARQALAADQFAKARDLATQWIERYPRHELLPEAYVLRGDARVADGDEYEALFDYEFVGKAYPGSEAFVIALERELEIAKQYAGGLKRKLWGLRIIDASAEAEELLILIQQRLPGSRLAEQAGLELGEYYFSHQELESAAEMYSIFIELYPRSEYVSEARRRLIYANIASFKGPEHDANGLIEARALLSALRTMEPATAQRVGADSIITRIDDSLAEKMLATALWYLKVNDAVSAEFTIRRLIRKYPASTASDRALKLAHDLVPSLPAAVQDEARQAGVYPASVWDHEDRGDAK